MECPIQETTVKRNAHTDSGVNLTQAVPYEPHAERHKFDIDEVLALPEPLPQPVTYGDRIGYAVMDMLPEIIGCRWEAVTMAAIRTLRPSAVRTVVKGQKMTHDAVWWRVTVMLDNGVVTRVQQEVKVVLPLSCANGRQFKLALGFKDDAFNAGTDKKRG